MSRVVVWGELFVFVQVIILVSGMARQVGYGKESCSVRYEAFVGIRMLRVRGVNKWEERGRVIKYLKRMNVAFKTSMNIFSGVVELVVPPQKLSLYKAVSVTEEPRGPYFSS